MNAEQQATFNWIKEGEDREEAQLVEKKKRYQQAIRDFANNLIDRKEFESHGQAYEQAWWSQHNFKIKAIRATFE